MLKALTLALCLAAVGCADSLPADTLTRFAHTLEALKHAYHATCDNREQAAECVAIRETVNDAIDRYTLLNSSLKDE